MTEGQILRHAREPSARIRVLATSDVHAHLRGFDYIRNEEVKDWGLARLATRIEQARAEVPATILLDNGDFLQGSPLAQLFSEDRRPDIHPVLDVMEAMGYDSIGLGNHEFNYGLSWLDQVLSKTRIPVLCANVLTKKSVVAEDDQSLFQPSIMLHKSVSDPDTGILADVKIGVVSVLPPQVMHWDGAHLRDHVEARDMVQSASVQVNSLRRAGADVVIVLAHTGIDPDGCYPEAENAAVALAQIPGVDGLITGHTHQLFPDASQQGWGVDAEAGTICGVPTVMPGYRGSHLGGIDLCLRREGAGWCVDTARAWLRPVAGAHEALDIVKRVDAAHEATLDYVAQPLGHTKRNLHSYLSQVRDELSTRIVAMAQRAAIAKHLENTPHGGLPLLSATAPYQTGGRAGPCAYVDRPAGALSLRDAIGLYPFPNTLCAVEVTGAEVRDWLERSASAYCQIAPGQGVQTLLNPAFPGHAMDTIYGLTYCIDLTVPPHYDEHGARVLQEGAPSRLSQLCLDGAPVAPDARFVVAVSGYRAYGGGPYKPVPSDRILVQIDASAIKHVADFLRRDGVDSVTDDPCWNFVHIAGATGVFETGPGLVKFPEEMAQLGLRADGITDEGFVRVLMPLDRDACESAA